MFRRFMGGGKAAPQVEAPQVKAAPPLDIEAALAGLAGKQVSVPPVSARTPHQL
jgi:hypothetical protein